MGQPEIKLGLIPGYGGTQRLPRIIGLERGMDLLRTGRPIFAKEICGWGWATGEPAEDYVGAAKELLRQHIDGKLQLRALDPAPMELPDELPNVDIGHHSIVVDEILVQVLRDGLTRPLPEGLRVEAAGFARCKETIDYGIGMTNFIINGPRVPAAFMHE
jgi:enoyl-CoA hydratase/carnithine racemase